jgi:hypothetical protein
LHKSAWKSDLGRQTISQFVINYFFIPFVTCFWAWKILLLLLHYCLVKKAWGDTNCCRYVTPIRIKKERKNLRVQRFQKSMFWYHTLNKTK